jgi:hypothetical protein
MPNSGYFDIKRDIEIEKAGGFWCHACLTGKSASEASPDSRYCQGCYAFLLKEAEMLPASKRPAWIPKPQKPEKAGEKQYQVSRVGDEIMSTLESKKFEVDIIHPPGATRAVVKRGPKHRQLPEDLIRQLANEGMGSKVIAARLKAEHDIIVSYKTIQRVLSGERKHLALPMSAP